MDAVEVDERPRGQPDPRPDRGNVAVDQKSDFRLNQLEPRQEVQPGVIGARAGQPMRVARLHGRELRIPPHVGFDQEDKVVEPVNEIEKRPRPPVGHQDVRGEQSKARRLRAGGRNLGFGRVEGRVGPDADELTGQRDGSVALAPRFPYAAQSSRFMLPSNLNWGAFRRSSRVVLMTAR